VLLFCLFFVFVFVFVVFSSQYSYSCVFYLLSTLIGFFHFLATLEKALGCFTGVEEIGTLWLKYIEYLRRCIVYDNPEPVSILLFTESVGAAVRHLDSTYDRTY
jgi:hypothetical protein